MINFHLNPLDCDIIGPLIADLLTLPVAFAFIDALVHLMTHSSHSWLLKLVQILVAHLCFIFLHPYLKNLKPQFFAHLKKQIYSYRLYLYGINDF